MCIMFSLFKSTAITRLSPLHQSLKQNSERDNFTATFMSLLTVWGKWQKKQKINMYNTEKQGCNQLLFQFLYKLWLSSEKYAVFTEKLFHISKTKVLVVNYASNMDVAVKKLEILKHECFPHMYITEDLDNHHSFKVDTQNESLI